MTKDPAVLFYTSDFLSGTHFFSYEQKGQYITLLCQQHQSDGIPENHMINICKSLDSLVCKKFIKCKDGMYRNIRMSEEAEKRKNFCKSRSNNKSGRKTVDKDDTENKSYDSHMENENENKNIKEDGIINYETLFTYWEQNKKGGKYKKSISRTRMFNKLKKLTKNNLKYAKKAIFHSIDNNYQGFCNGDELFYKQKPNQEVIEQDGKIGNYSKLTLPPPYKAK